MRRRNSACECEVNKTLHFDNATVSINNEAWAAAYNFTDLLRYGWEGEEETNPRGWNLSSRRKLCYDLVISIGSRYNRGSTYLRVAVMRSLIFSACSSVLGPPRTPPQPSPTCGKSPWLPFGMLMTTLYLLRTYPFALTAEEEYALNRDAFFLKSSLQVSVSAKECDTLLIFGPNSSFCFPLHSFSFLSLLHCDKCSLCHFFNKRNHGQAFSLD